MTSSRRRQRPAAGAGQPVAAPTASMAILQRRDVAFVPLLVIAVGSFALALSEGLRPPARPDNQWADDTVVFGAFAFGVVAAIGALLQDTAWSERRRGRLTIYLVWSATLLAALTVAGVLDQGLASVSYNAVMLLMPYVGLVFPRRWSRISLVVVLMSMGAVQLAVPDADFIEAGSTMVLAVSGWLVGLIARLGHYRASRQALILSRTDVLTGALNRRGFIEHMDWALDGAARDAEPVALLVIDLNGFKLINDADGHAAGDALLAWVGRQVPEFLPDGAAFGRLGGDEFAILANGIAEDEALALGRQINETLAEKVGASIGVATSRSGLAEADELLRNADLALYTAKADPAARVQRRDVLDDGRARPGADSPRLAPPPVSYARLRGRVARVFSYEPSTFDGIWVLAGFSTIAAAGATFVASTIADGADSIYGQLIIFCGVPWVLLNLGAGLYFRRRAQHLGAPEWGVVWFSAVTVGLGVGTAALSTGDGVASPIIAGLYLKILFDAAAFERRQAQETSAFIVACWAVALMLGPPDSLWVAPFQAALLVGAYFVGSIGREAFNEAITARMELASRDPLTGLLNRRGWVRRVERALEKGVGDGLRIGIVAVDLDGFKQVNDTQGHAVGDRLLQAVASVATDALRDAEGIGRLGGDEFVAAVRVRDRRDLDAVVAQLDARLEVVTAGSVGGAIQGTDGQTLEELLQVADHRAYAVKQARVARRLLDEQTGAPGRAN